MCPAETEPAFKTIGAVHLMIGGRLRSLRIQKKLSQGDIERRSGLLRPYLSRVEQGHVVPSIVTLEKMARALEVPLYRFFYEGEGLTDPPTTPLWNTVDKILRNCPKRDAHFLKKLRRLLRRVNEADRRVLLQVAQKMARR